MILEPRLIAVEYMKTWFFLDLLSSLPVDYIFLVLDSGLLDTHLVSRFKLVTIYWQKCPCRQIVAL